MAQGVEGQSDENQILRKLADETHSPKTFVEFGFHPAEFNSVSLISDHTGLLIDGNSHHVGGFLFQTLCESRTGF